MRPDSSWTVAIALFVACTPSADKPADPIWGKQACGHCSMLVTEKPPAAQLTLADGTRTFFDDLGCMVLYLGDKQLNPRRLWVREQEAWVAPAQTRFIAGQKTPMDFGFLAHAPGPLSWDEVRAAVRERAGRNKR